MSSAGRPVAAALAAAEVGAWVQGACRAELRALKPGNVGIHGAGHGMTLRHFLRSARVMAPAIAAPGLAVGARILAAVEATRAAVGCNTNLGIVLLCAPLVQALLDGGRGPLRPRLAAVLAGLDRDDARHAYAAIRLAAPGGLGRSAEHDVADAPSVTLREAMAAGAMGDRIARQYLSDYADVFHFVVPRLQAHLRCRGSEPWAVTAAYLETLARFPDTHILRKHGPPVAEAVSRRAARFAVQLGRCRKPQTLEGALRLFDEELKDAGINPGTTADLLVAGLLVCRAEVPQWPGGTPRRPRDAGQRPGRGRARNPECDPGEGDNHGCDQSRDGR